MHRVLVRHGLNRLAWMDRPTGRVIRRIHTDRPGELVHIDVKKLGRIPDGGGWRATAAATSRDRRHAERRLRLHPLRRRRLQPARLQRDPRRRERRRPASAFSHAPTPGSPTTASPSNAVLTDNGTGYRSYAWRDLCAELGIDHTRTRPYRPQTNGKVERFNRTLLDEWAYVRVYRSERRPHRALDRWLHLYNHHRSHTALGGHPPIEPRQQPAWSLQLADRCQNRTTGEVTAVAGAADRRRPGWLDDQEWRVVPNKVQALAARAGDRLVFLCGSTANEDEVWHLFSRVIYLVIDEQTLRDRLASRTSNDFGKTPTELAAILSWHQVGEADYVGFGAAIVDATVPLRDVVDHVLDASG